jgi:hypothetical protein
MAESPPSTSMMTSFFRQTKSQIYRPDRLLPNELMAVDLPIANAVPELRFGIGLIDAQFARPERPANRTTHCLAPHPKASLRSTFDLSPQKSGRVQERAAACSSGATAKVP